MGIALRPVSTENEDALLPGPTRTLRSLRPPSTRCVLPPTLQNQTRNSTIFVQRVPGMWFLAFDSLPARVLRFGYRVSGTDLGYAASPCV
eukprot:704704-Rhodomonas_salina.3